jgi:hypothetical protein
MGCAWREASLLLIAAHGNCNGNGNGATVTRIAIAMALGQGHWGRSNRSAVGKWGNRATAIDRRCMFYLEDHCHVLWLTKPCKTCGRPILVTLFLRTEHTCSSRYFYLEYPNNTRKWSSNNGVK